MVQRSILCVSFDENVSRERAEALRRAGYEVVPTVNIERAFRLLDERKFDLVIVGHRFLKNDKQALISDARDTWHTPVLLVCGTSADADLAADVRVYALEGISAVVAAVSHMLPLPAPV